MCSYTFALGGAWGGVDAAGGAMARAGGTSGRARRGAGALATAVAEGTPDGEVALGGEVVPAGAAGAAG